MQRSIGHKMYNTGNVTDTYLHCVCVIISLTEQSIKSESEGTLLLCFALVITFRYPGISSVWHISITALVISHSDYLVFQVSGTSPLLL